MSLSDVLQQALAQNVSDIHLLAGSAPFIRVNGVLKRIEGHEILTPELITSYLQEMLNQDQLLLFQNNKEIDLSYQFDENHRFRVNVYYQQGTPAVAFRFIPNRILSIDELQLPRVFHDIAQLRQGLVLVTGPAGEGKSTTLAAVIEEINQTRAEHIVTIEDPIEFIYKPSQSIVSQREIAEDTKSWGIALKSVLREDPDVVLIGEMRDLETISAALTIAETGHLVLATLHTNSAGQTVDRIIDVFPESQQEQTRQQLAATLAAVFSQRLVPSRKDSRVLAMEIMIATQAVKNLIREGKSYQIDNVLQTSSEYGMLTLEASLANWVKTGLVADEVARRYAIRPLEYDRLMKGM